MTNTTKTSRNPFAGAMRPVNAVVERFIPSALVFAVLLTFVVAALALLLTDAGPTTVLTGWGDGLSGLLEFMTQMALVLLLGHMLANTRLVRRGLARVSALPRGPLQAYVFVAVLASALSLVQWGLGLVAGGLLAREVAAQMRAKGVRVHFPLLVAAGFSGFVVWHMGYTGSGPLTAATADSFVVEQLGETIPVAETTFAPWNMVAALVTVVVVAGALALVAPRGTDRIVELEVDAREAEVEVERPVTPADRLDASRVLTTLTGLGLVAYLVVYFAGGGTPTLDIVNWTFLALVLLLVRSPFEVAALVKNAATNVGDILLQFPLYAGILGIMTATGLIQIFSDAIVSVSTPQTFGALAFVAAGVVNFFVPSGGGQFAVQAPILLDAATQLGVDPSIAIMAVAYGDQWTNMIQPFWALPLLAIAGLKVRDILGYTTVTLLASGIVFAATLLIVGPGA
ncbi:short-chain fatty acid transporter [Promicromonospora panici]|uniref:short-chain fatty acid transporter n=1 Tax=Promicromonospora panici TaxID=2219658 RepID=UPI001F5DAD54|nr:TIGR00366 family protein [Promicromonospora panici]